MRTGRDRVFWPELDHRYPVIVDAEGVRLRDSEGKAYLDAMSGGSMAATLGYGRGDLVEAARRQASHLSFAHNELLTSTPQERLARELVAVAPPGITRVQFVTGGAEANEAALRLARSYHVERGEEQRWRIVSPAQAYHGPTMATLALTGRPGLYEPFSPYLADHLHVPPATWRFDPTGEAALAALDRALDECGEEICAYFCEVVSAASLPSYTPPLRFWEGLAERRERHGFLICVDEVVTGVGRTGEWFASERLPFVPDVIATAKGLGAGYAAIGAVLCDDRVYRTVEAGSRRLPLGHTWSGAPLSCAVGVAVLEALQDEGHLAYVAEQGPWLRQALADALGEMAIVREVRGHGFLLGVEYVDPRDGRSFLPPQLGVAGRIDAACMRRGLVILSTAPTGDGFAGDQSLFAPAFAAVRDDLKEMVATFADAVREVADTVEAELAAVDAPPLHGVSA
ncbi:MAG: aspartate aminotransferase family protein [Solirubrobacterales bacterium]